jgi:hypothetical protein
MLAGPVESWVARPAPVPEPPPNLERSAPPVLPPRVPRPRAPKAEAQKLPPGALGPLMVELGHVTEAQIAQALELQASKGLPLGECLLLYGFTSPDRVLEALRIQAHLRSAQRDPDAPLPSVDAASAAAARAPADATTAASPQRGYRVTEQMFLGEVLLGMEAITEEQLERAMHMHHHKGLPVGQALIELGALTERDLHSALEFQRSLREIARLARLTRTHPEHRARRPEAG